ncbi:MAG: N-acetylmuramoyl-L-alanine amidase [Clostridia bacterium]|nr:N-acetylmuramoyl-L-alanine amidase [Clostridia bacterium]
MSTSPSQGRPASRSPLPAYILFVLLFLSLTAALLSLCRVLAGKDALPTQQPNGASNSSPFSSYVFVIDAGHGGEDGGAVGYVDGRQLTEKQVNLAIANALTSLLEDAGAQVIMTRTEDILLYDRNSDYQGRKKALDMAARLAITEQAGKDGATVIFVSIHQNTFSDSRYSGLQVYYSANTPDSARLANTIQATARAQLDPDNSRATKNGSDIYLLKNLHYPAVLVECGFLSNPDECASLSTETYQNRVAYTIFTALRQYTNETP